jgi:hypothetical protein
LNKAKYKKAITVITVIASVLTVLSAIFPLGIRAYLRYKFHVDAGSRSGGIIGGADGRRLFFSAARRLSVCRRLFWLRCPSPALLI